MGPLPKGGITVERYEILSVLSSHGNNTVWLAKHRELGTKRIIKRIARDPAHSAEQEREVHLMKDLKHPCIPSLIDVFKDNSYQYLVEEYIEGESLGELCSHRLLSESEVLSYFVQIAKILSFLHSKPNEILYLDLKPSNLIISKGKKDETGQVYLTDFGSAMHINDTYEVRYGTEGFCAPEQRNRERLGFEADVYALGCLLRYMLTNSVSDKRVAERLERIAQKCCMSNRRKRPGSVDVPMKMVRRIMEKEDRSREKGNKRESEKKQISVGVLGTGAGAGVTHIAICIAAVLAADRKKVCFRERSAHRDIGKLNGSESEAFTYKKVDFFTEENEAHCIGRRPGYDYEIFDLGCSKAKLRELARCDIKLIVGPCAKWRTDEYRFLNELKNNGTDMSGWNLLVNLSTEEMLRDREEKLNGIAFPPVTDPFRPEKKVKEIIESIILG